MFRRSPERSSRPYCAAGSLPFWQVRIRWKRAGGCGKMHVLLAFSEDQLLIHAFGTIIAMQYGAKQATQVWMPIIDWQH